VEALDIRHVTPHKAEQFAGFVEELTTRFGTTSDPEFLRHSSRLALDLGSEIWGLCRPPRPTAGMFVLRGVAVPDGLGPTPAHWSLVDSGTTARWDMAMLLLASVMGQVFGWEGQQDGRIVHHIVPTPGCEREQTGASSRAQLVFHTEDSFHPARAHLILLGCLRNPDNVATHVSSVRHTRLSSAEYRTLSLPKVQIAPDTSYAPGQSAAPPPGVRTVWPDRHGYCIRYDPAYSRLPKADPEYQAAYGHLTQELHERLSAVRLQPGDIAVLDNDVVVHGRAPFTARYDGNDRWLTRVSVHAPWRSRPRSEDLEHGYGQDVVHAHGHAVRV
jgi:L-asparagine oxygenase